ncbi:MAG: trimethylamine corrinoid protein 2, partial [Candidatus Caldatribacteriaceae bacterium]
MKYKDDWEETKRRFMAWWHRSFVDRPLLRIIAKRREPLESLEPVSPPQNPEEYHLDVERKVKKFRNFCRTHLFLAEAFPSLDVDLGPGSMATYLGAKPVFAWDTVWYIPCLMGNLDKYRVSYQEENPWWENISIWSKELAGKDFLVNIPDIMESVDVLASLRGPQELVYDLIDSPSKIQKLISELDRLYPHYYQSFYDVVTQEGGSSYTVFP